MPRALWCPQGGLLFFMSEAPLYMVGDGSSAKERERLAFRSLYIIHDYPANGPCCKRYS